MPIKLSALRDILDYVANLEPGYNADHRRANRPWLRIAGQAAGRGAAYCHSQISGSVLSARLALLFWLAGRQV